MKLKKILKRNNLIILIFSLCVIISCKSKPNNLSNNNCSVIYEDKRPRVYRGHDPLNGLSIERFKEVVSKQDSISINFLSTFLNDTVYIYKGEKLLTLAILKSDMSLAYAKTIKLPKFQFNNTSLTLKFSNKIVCPIKIDNEYLFINVYYNREQKKVDVYFSNNLLMLS